MHDHMYIRMMKYCCKYYLFVCSFQS